MTVMLIVTMASGDSVTIRLDESITNQKGKIEELKSAIKNGALFEADESCFLNGRLVESFRIHNPDDDLV